jgi:4-hydroxy-tetrahydrodipicolinate synthase
LLHVPGSIPALVTPFTETGAVDEKACRHVGGRSPRFERLVPVGTDESPTLSHAGTGVVELCVEVANKRVPVIAAPDQQYQGGVELAQHAEKVSAPRCSSSRLL